MAAILFRGQAVPINLSIPVTSWHLNPNFFPRFVLAIKETSHDDVIKWKYFPCYWPFVRGIDRSPVNSPHKGQWHRALIFSLICAWINSWVNNRDAGDLRRHRAHYDVNVMKLRSIGQGKFPPQGWIIHIEFAGHGVMFHTTMRTRPDGYCV